MLRIRSVVSRIKTSVAAAVVVVSAAVQPLMAQAPAALSQAPEGAQFVLIVPNMTEFSGKLAMLNQTLGLELAEWTDALGAFKAEIGISDGMNDAGSALLIIPDLASAIINDQEPDILLALPVTDYAAFISSFQPDGAAPAGVGVTEITMPDGQAGYARESGGYAIMGNTELAVVSFVPAGDADAIGSRVGAHGLDYLGSCDAAVYLDLKAMAPTLAPKIDELMAEFQNEINQAGGAGMTDPASIEMMQAGMNLYASAAKSVINSTDGMVITLDISEHGVGLSKAAQLLPDSQVMQYLPGSDDNTSAILSRLPGGSYIAAGALNMEAIACSELLDAAMAQLPEGNAQIDMYRKSLPMIKQIQQYAGVFYTPDPAALMGGTGGINVVATYKIADAENYIQTTKDYIKSMNGMSIPMGVPMGDGQAAPVMTYITSYTDNALQLDGVQVDQYSMQMQMPPEMMMQMGPAAGFMQMFTNFNGYAAVDDGHYITTTTLDQQLMTKALATGKAGDGIGNADTLAEVREYVLPEGGIGEMYLSLSGVVEMVGPMAMMFGLPPIEAPQDLPPVGFGMGLKDNSAAGRIYVPNATTKFVVDTVKDIQAQMMGGPGGSGGYGQPQQPGQGPPPPPF